MKNVLKWFWNDKPSLLMLIIALEMIVAHIITGKDFTLFMALLSLYVVVSVVERGKLTTRMDEAIHDPDLRDYFKLGDKGWVKPRPTIFGWIIRTIINVGTLGLLVLVFLYLIDVIL